MSSVPPNFSFPPSSLDVFSFSFVSQGGNEDATGAAAGATAAERAANPEQFKVPFPPSDPPVLGPPTQEEATAKEETPSGGAPPVGTVTPITSIGPPKNKKKRKKANQTEGNNAPGSISAALSHAANLPSTSAAANSASYDAIGSAVEQFKASLGAEAATAVEGGEGSAHEAGTEPPAKKMQIMISPSKCNWLISSFVAARRGFTWPTTYAASIFLLGESEKYRELQQQAQLHMLQNQQAQQQAQEQQQQQQLALAAAESQLSPGQMIGHQVMMPGQPMLHPGQVPGKSRGWSRTS